MPHNDTIAADGGAPGHGRRVLVIEDNRDAAASLVDVLELSGHSVDVAATGRAGLELARRLRPDVILCDIGLPDIDGYEIASSVRGDESLRSTLLIALTGYAQAEDRRRALDAGFDAHLAKPAHLAQLEALIGAPAAATRPTSVTSPTCE